MNIGWVSATPIAKTGYGSQTLEVCDRLSAHHKVVCIGQVGDVMVWGGRQTVTTQSGRNLIVLPLADPKSAIDVINHYYIPEFKLDMIVGFMDAFGIDYLSQVNVPVVGWIPIDGTFTDMWAYYVRTFHRVVAYSQYGYNQLRKFFPPGRIDYVPHGISESFKPKVREHGRKALSRCGIPEQGFLVMTVGANIGPRKEIPLMIKTFSRFVEQGHRDAHLYIHTNPNQMWPKGYDLIQWRRMMKMENNVHFPLRDPIFSPVENDVLAELHSAADLYWQNSVAEGFGLPIGEALACGTPVMVPENSAQTELVSQTSSGPGIYDRGILTRSIPDTVYEQIPVYVPQLPTYAVPDQSDVFDKLNWAYDHQEDLGDMGVCGATFINEYHRWDRVIHEWLRVLQQVESEFEFFEEIQKYLRVAGSTASAR